MLREEFSPASDFWAGLRRVNFTSFWLVGGAPKRLTTDEEAAENHSLRKLQHWVPMELAEGQDSGREPW